MWMPSNTNLFLDIKSHQHPGNKQSGIFTWHRDPKSPATRKNLMLNWTPSKGPFYGMKHFRRTLNRIQQQDRPRGYNLTSMAIPSFAQNTFNRVTRTLYKRKIKIADLHQDRSFLRVMKENLDLKAPAMQRTTCEYGKMYTEQTGRPINERKIHL
jgi:hypothetical protein